MIILVVIILVMMCFSVDKLVVIILVMMCFSDDNFSGNNISDDVF